MNSEEKAKDNQSSGYMLVGFGSIGLILVALAALGILSIPGIGNAILVYGVMGALFFVFLVMGIVSLIHAGTYRKLAEEERGITSVIREWCQENLTRERIEEELADELSDCSEEEAYYHRMEYMREKISGKFMNLKETLEDRILEEWYETLYREGEE